MSISQQMVGRRGHNSNIVALGESLCSMADSWMIGTHTEGDDPRPRDPGFREGKVHDNFPLHLVNPARMIEGGYKVIRARRRAE